MQKESMLLCSNYWPVSLLSNIDKTLKKIIYNRIYKFLGKNIFPSVWLSALLMKALHDGNFACGVFCDLQKAFDTVDQSILLSKLCYYGMRGLTNKMV